MTVKYYDYKKISKKDKKGWLILNNLEKIDAINFVFLAIIAGLLITAITIITVLPPEKGYYIWTLVTAIGCSLIFIDNLISMIKEGIDSSNLDKSLSIISLIFNLFLMIFSIVVLSTKAPLIYQKVVVYIVLIVNSYDLLVCVLSIIQTYRKIHLLNKKYEINFNIVKYILQDKKMIQEYFEYINLNTKAKITITDVNFNDITRQVEIKYEINGKQEKQKIDLDLAEEIAYKWYKIKKED